MHSFPSYYIRLFAKMTASVFVSVSVCMCVCVCVCVCVFVCKTCVYVCVRVFWGCGAHHAAIFEYRMQRFALDLKLADALKLSGLRH
jgi:hypothetical protein